MNLIQTKSFQIAIYAAGEPSSKAIALVLPGRLETKDYAHMRSHTDHLASIGYYALSFDPPGTWDSSGDIAMYISENYLKAVHELIAYFGDRPTLLVGHSRGGSMAMLAAVSNPVVTAFVSIMGSALPAEVDKEWQQQQQQKRTFYRDLPPGNKASENKKVFELSYSFFKGADNLLTDLGKCSKPKLFILGSLDAQNTPELIKVGYDASAKPKRLYELNAGHGYRYSESAINDVNQSIESFVTDFKLNLL
jgi:hypothetical protein